MTVKTKGRATSTLSPVPDMLQSPVSNTMTPKSKTANGKLGQEKESIRTAINRRLQYDQQAIKAARNAAADDPNWSKMDVKRQEKLQEKASLSKIQQRKEAGIHVSNHYPIFKDYVPHSAYGITKRGDIERDTLIIRHLDSLNDASARVQSEEGDDEELDPRIKKQEHDDDRELKDISPYTKGQKATTTKRGKVGKGTMTDEDSDIGDSSAADSNDEDEDVSEAESEISELESEEDEDEDGDDDDEDEHVTFVAVSRGRPLPSDIHVPAKAYVNRKQHFATGIKCIEQAVVRGQVPRDDETGQRLDSAENKDSIPKKRSCEDVESGGRGLRKSKRVKTETNV